MLVNSMRSVFNKTAIFKIDLDEIDPGIVCPSEKWQNELMKQKLSSTERL